MNLGEPKFTKRYRTALLIDAGGGGLCSMHGAYFGHGKYGIRDCPFCDFECHLNGIKDDNRPENKQEAEVR